VIPADKVTIFDATGMGIQDAAVASLNYEVALRISVGTWAEV
jgi:ornithine cyclodeaminase/alanine dehydrogenase-like protein (mu-crystallin family)